MSEKFCVEGFWDEELRRSRKELFYQVGSSLFKRVKWFYPWSGRKAD